MGFLLIAIAVGKSLEQQEPQKLTWNLNKAGLGKEKTSKNMSTSMELFERVRGGILAGLGNKKFLKNDAWKTTFWFLMASCWYF